MCVYNLSAASTYLHDNKSKVVIRAIPDSVVG